MCLPERVLDVTVNGRQKNLVCATRHWILKLDVTVNGRQKNLPRRVRINRSVWEVKLWV